MSGHSQFKNIMYRKSIQDVKRARTFTKLTQEIISACNIGLPRPEANPRLRAAIQAAKDQNMPHDSIDRALHKASMVKGGYYKNVRYEGYGPGKVAFIIETLTNNRNRTAAEIRVAFSRNGGSLMETNSVVFNFERVGILYYTKKAISEDNVLEVAARLGVRDVDFDDNTYQILCAPEHVSALQEAIKYYLGVPKMIQMEWKPLITIPIVDVSTARNLLKFLSLLNENDDVQRVTANFDIPGTLLESLNVEEI